MNEQERKLWIANLISILLFGNAGLLRTMADFLPLVMEVPHPSEAEKILYRRIELKFKFISESAGISGHYLPLT